MDAKSGVEPDSDYNRTVITIAGIPKSVVEAAKRLVTKACEEIDMQVHNGEHPRLGAVDVVPSYTTSRSYNGRLRFLCK